MTPEVTLLLALTEVPGDGGGEVSGRPEPGLDDNQWARFGDLCARHRVEGLVAGRLSELPDLAVPEQLAAHLKREAHRNKLQALACVQEFQRIHEACAAAGLRVVPVKGVDLVQRVYPDPGARSFMDMDLLIPPDRVKDARRILGGMGYVPPPSSWPWLRGFHFHQPLLNRKTGRLLEVHWALTDAQTSRFSDSRLVWSLVQGGPGYPVLPDDVYACYLAVHLAKHGVLNQRLVAHPRGAALALHPFSELKLIWFHDLNLFMKNRGLTRQHVLSVADRFVCRAKVREIFALNDRLWPGRADGGEPSGRRPGETFVESLVKNRLVARMVADVDAGGGYGRVLPWILRTDRHLHFRPARLIFRGGREEEGGERAG